MSVDSNSVNLNTSASYSAYSANVNYKQFDPISANLNSYDDFATLPVSVQTVLNATGVYNLNKTEGWTKTTLNSAALIKLFGGNTIYTPPADSIGMYSSELEAELSTNQFNDFTNTLFADNTSTDETSGDGYTAQESNSNSLSDALMSLLNTNKTTKK